MAGGGDARREFLGMLIPKICIEEANSQDAVSDNPIFVFSRICTVSLMHVSIKQSLITFFQVMQSERMLYLVTEYASGGEIFGKYSREVVLCVYMPIGYKF